MFYTNVDSSLLIGRTKVYVIHTVRDFFQSVLLQPLEAALVRTNYKLSEAKHNLKMKRYNVEVVGSSPIKGPRCFLEQETLPLFLSTGWFQERIRA